MKSVIQRVTSASVTVDNECVGQIEHGLLVYLGVEKGDTEKELSWLCSKIARLRIFADDEGKMNLDIKQVGGSILVISQFTLCANMQKGNRPSYHEAAEPQDALRLYEKALTTFRSMDLSTEGGVFGAHMHVTYTNDGPVTMILEA